MSPRLAGRVAAAFALALAAAPACRAPGHGPAWSALVAARDVERDAVSADGLRVHYRARLPEAPRVPDGPVVVLVHGWSCDGRVWDEVAPGLRSRWPLVTLDLGGHGRSGSRRSAFTVEAFAGDVLAVIDDLGLVDAVLVGHSLGGPVCLEAAVVRPDDVRGVVLVDALHDAGFVYDEAARTRLLAPFEDDAAAATRAFVPRLLHPDTDTRRLAPLVDAMAARPPRIARDALRRSFDHDVRATLAELAVPVVSVNGSLVPTNLAANRALHEPWTVIVVEGAGHYPHLEAPEACAAALVDAVQRLGG